MGKTDKELAVEIALAYIQSWHSVENRRGLSGDDVKNLIQTAYNTIHQLPD